MSKKVIPRWIILVTSAIGVLGMFVGTSLYYSPATFIKDVDFSSSGVRYLAHMWGARQITLGAILWFSTFRRSIPMMQLALGAYSLMNAQDIVIGISRNDPELIIGATLFLVGPAYLARHLGKYA